MTHTPLDLSRPDPGLEPSTLPPPLTDPTDAAFADARLLFFGLGPISHQRMVDGAAFYVDETMFALVTDGEIFLCADAALAADIADLGGAPTYIEGGRSAVHALYWSIPNSALDDGAVARELARRAVAVARATAVAKARHAAAEGAQTPFDDAPLLTTLGLDARTNAESDRGSPSHPDALALLPLSGLRAPRRPPPPADSDEALRPLRALQRLAL